MISTEEKKKVFEITIDEAKDTVNLIAQISSTNLYEAVDLAKYVTNLGYKCLSAVTPFYYKFDFSEIKDYYENNSKRNRKLYDNIFYSIFNRC